MKTVTAQTVSKVLATQFQRSTTSTTRVRGWHNQTAGFKVSQLRIGAFVEYITNSFNRDNNVNEQARLSAYAELLKSKGFTVEMQQDRWGSFSLVVTKDN